MPNRLFFTHQAHVLGHVLMLSAASAFAVFNLLIKLMQHDFGVWHIAFYRFVFGALVTFILMLSQRTSFKGMGIGLLLSRGLLGTLSFLCMLVAIRSISLSRAIIFFYSFPVFAALFSGLIFKERITLAEMICVLVAFFGIGILYEFGFEGSLSGQAVALLAGILGGLVVSIIRKLREANGSAIIYFYFCVIGLVMTAPFFMIDPKIPQNMHEVLWLIAAVCFITIGQLLMTQAFRYCKSWEGGVLMMFEVVITAFLCIVVLHELLTWQLVAGGALVISSALGLNAVSASRKPPKRKSTGSA